MWTKRSITLATVAVGFVGTIGIALSAVVAGFVGKAIYDWMAN